MLPLAAVVIALPAALVLWVAAVLGLPPLAAAIFALAAMTAVTGALHEDGLADIADGFWGGGDRARRLEIMRDSRIGSYGTLALVFATAAKIVLLAEAIAAGGAIAGGAVLLATAVAARTAALWPWMALPPARADGVAHGAGRPTRRTAAIAASLAAAIVAVCLVPLAPAALAVAPAATALAVIAVARLARGKIGGHTGDVIGGAEQAAEIAFLTGIVICL
jgi:adenosylcobinamide-GDP ribazoletransferase